MGLEGPNKPSFGEKIKKIARVVAVGATLTGAASAAEAGTKPQPHKGPSFAQKLNQVPSSSNIEDRRNNPLDLQSFITTTNTKHSNSKPDTRTQFGPYDKDIEQATKRIQQQGKKQLAKENANRSALDERLRKLEEQAARELPADAEVNIWRKKE